VIFRDENSFLSNFYPAKIVSKTGKVWPTAEHLFHACKTLDKEEVETIRKHPIKGLRSAGRKVTLRENWDKIKLDIMRRIVNAKFAQHPDLMAKLRAIKGLICEDNYWHDNFWGNCRCDRCINKQSENHLGRILMDIRDANQNRDYKVVVAGGRTFTDYDLMKERLDKILEGKSNITIVSGTAKGADKLGERYAKERGYNIKRMPANWDKHGRSAGYKRNEEMAKVGDHVVCFWDGNSSGTKHMIDLARKYELVVDVIKY